MTSRPASRQATSPTAAAASRFSVWSKGSVRKNRAAVDVSGRLRLHVSQEVFALDQNEEKPVRGGERQREANRRD